MVVMTVMDGDGESSEEETISASGCNNGSNIEWQRLL